MSEHGSPPLLRIVRGAPDATEVAAVVALVTAMAGAGGTAAAPVGGSGWTDRSRLVRRPVQHGPGAWRASVAPR